MPFAPLPPLGLVAGYYTASGYCRNSTEYFAYDGKRAGMVMQHATDLVPVAALKKIDNTAYEYDIKFFSDIAYDALEKIGELK